MSLKLSVGVAKKMGQPRFGSYGAQCTLEVALSGVDLAELDKLQKQLRRGFEVCRAAVEEELELARRVTAAHEGLIRAGARRRSAARPATSAQRRAVHAIVRRRRLDLYRELGERFEGRGLDDLTLEETSGLIDALKAEAAGEIHQA